MPVGSPGDPTTPCCTEDQSRERPPGLARVCIVWLRRPSTITHGYGGVYVEGPGEVMKPVGGACEQAAFPGPCPGPTGAVKPLGFFLSRSSVSGAEFGAHCGNPPPTTVSKRDKGQRTCYRVLFRRAPAPSEEAYTEFHSPRICLFLLLFPIFWEVGHRGSSCDASITSHIHSWVFFLLWLHPFILSG